MKFHALALAVASTAVLAGCAAGHHQPAATPTATPHANPLASVPGYDKQAALTVLRRDGVPVDGPLSAQIAYGKKLLTKDGRKAVAKQLAIPQGNRTAFENEAFKDAKADHVVTSHAGRVKFFQTDLPGLLVKYDQKK